MIRLVIEIYRDDRLPWQAVKTYAHPRDHDFSELATAERFAAHIRMALREHHVSGCNAPRSRQRC